MKKLFFIFIVILFFQNVKAAHITGGEIFYDYIGIGNSSNTNKFRITLRLFRDNFSTGANMPLNVYIGIFDYGTKSQFPSSGSFFDVQRTSIIAVPKIQSDCAQGDTILAYTMGVYSFIVDLPNNIAGYIASYETCCRINSSTGNPLNSLINVNSPAGTGGTGATYVVRISGHQSLPGSGVNSGPRFRPEVYLVCNERQMEWKFDAFDPDGDSLVYSFVSAYDKVTAQSSTNINPNAPASSPPDYPSVPYINGYSGSVPLGNSVNINPNTGLISGVAPSGGLYVVCVLIKEYRNGVLIGEHRKDLILKVGNCDFGGVKLEPNSVTCDGFTRTFYNLISSSLNKTFYWDFGVLGITTDTSTLENPTYTYPDTGVYIIKLVVNRGQACSDSTTTKLGVYPGFFPNFNSTGVCYTSPIQFNDVSTTAYGVIDSWRWDFGDLGVLSDTSHIKNPQYTYPNSGTKTVQLIVTNSKGCKDTVENDIVLIDKPIINLPFKDTLICSIDTLQLQSSFSSGNPTWTPNYRIINPNSFTPLVYPLVTTTYIITANDQGCIQKDSIKVNVVNFVTIDVMPDTAICLTDAFRIRTISDALSYIWTPSNTLDNPNIKQPIATPVGFSTKYVVNANIGKCQSKDSVTVTTYPYPLVDAGIGGTICYGDQLQLNGTASGNVFQWSPLLGLVNGNTLNPIAKPTQTTQYVLSTTNLLGCKKPARDTVVVIVIPPIIAFAGNDTTVVVGQPLQLNATGSTNYIWTPSSFLSNPTIANPIATLNANQTYAVRVSDVNGCFAIDSIKITVFQTAPDIFVPTAFSPNNDGTNDKLLPVAVGLKSFDFFEVYNRWGQRVFRTTQLKVGWDGTYRGVPQNNQAFVWQVQGTDYTGKRIYKKGTAVLIQ